MEKKIVLAMMVAPLMGHLAQSLELAKLMLQRNNQLSITVFIMEVPINPEGTAKVQSLISGCTIERLHFHHLPTPQDTTQWNIQHSGFFVFKLVEHHKPNVRETLSRIDGLAGIILDMVGILMQDVADELGVPSYLFCTSGAAFLGLLFHLQTGEDEQNQQVSDLVKTEAELIIPTFINRVPIKSLPGFVTHEGVWSNLFLKITRQYRKVKAILVNTFEDIESYPLRSFSSGSSYGKSNLPPMYPVGPILNRIEIKTQSSKDPSEIMNWLDAQPESAVVFLCFGSMTSFNENQVKEIAYGIERSGYRFLWVLRRPSAEKGGFASDYENPELVLPPGFLDRTASSGKVVGWVPQLRVLSHPAVGGFVSHCGWNSTLESIWCGVLMATWPMQAEQQLNAYQLVRELGIAVEISLNFAEHNEMTVVKSERIEKGIRDLMDGSNEARKMVKECSEKGRLAMAEGGSSYLSLGNFIQSFGNHSF